MQNAQISSYPKFQIILCKTGVEVKGFILVQASLKGAFWAEKRELLLRILKVKKEKIVSIYAITKSPNHFLTSYEMPRQKYFFGLILLYYNFRVLTH